MTTSPQIITFGEMRTSGVHDVLIYCHDHRDKPPCVNQRGRLAR